MADVPAIGPHSGSHFSHDKTLDNSTKQYNQLTGLKLFAMSCSVVISVDEFAPFGKAGATSLFWLLIAGILWFLPITQETGEMASIDGWGDGGIFTWVKGTLGEKSGWTAMFYQWIHITVGMDTMMYFVIGAFSIAFNTPWFNTQPLIRFGLMMIILWGCVLIQHFGEKRVGKIAEWLFGLGIATPVILLIIVFITYLIQGNPIYVHLSWHTMIPSKFNGTTLVAFVPFILAFCGGEAQAPHVKNLEHPNQYPKVMLGLALTAICFDLLGSLSIAMTVPKADIQNSTGFVYTYGHLLSSIGLPGDLLGKIVGVLLACGIIGELSNWLAGPNQGLFVAARQGYMPKYFAKPNKRGVPMRIVVLQAIVVTITALMITFDSGENADFAFNVSMAATTAQYLMVYLMMIVAYIVLKNKYENLHRTYRMSNSRTFSIVVAVIGFFITLMAFFITFIPAEGTPAHLRFTYVITLIIMVVIVGILPLIMYRYHDKWSKEVAQYLKEEDKTLTQENK